MQRWSVCLVLVVACSTENELAGQAPTLEGTTEPSTAPECDLPQPEDYTYGFTPDCHDEPVIGGFDPIVEWQWNTNTTNPGHHQVMATPAVGQLTDDDGDGDVDSDDTPDVVFTAFAGSGYGSPGALVAISGADGSQIWSSTSLGGNLPYGASGVAIAQLDGQHPVVLVTTTTGLAAVDGADGALRWLAATELPSGGYGHPAIADIDVDGVAEVIFGRQVLDAYGNILWTGAGGTGGTRFNSFAVDLDGDLLMEVVAGNTVYESNGDVRWQVGADGWPAVADMDLDGKPDLVRVLDTGIIEVYDAGGTLMWSHDPPDDRGGPPTIADFDGDGEPEIGVAYAGFYRVIEEAGELWSMPVSDFSSSRTGSSVFDFEGDGAAEVVYADEHTLWVFDGGTGTVELQWEDHASGTLYEYPLVADVDGDGASEIVVASNNYAHPGTNGITVLGDRYSTWAPSREIWNQHAYFIDHVRDDGTIPQIALQPWTWHNSFRSANPVTAVGLRRADLAPGEPVVCADACSWGTVLAWFPVENRGEVAGQDVVLSVEGATGVVATAELGIARAGELLWAGPFEIDTAAFADGPLDVVVTRGGTTGECDVSNNVRSWANPCVEEQ